jgi:hypothetical protein
LRRPIIPRWRRGLIGTAGGWPSGDQKLLECGGSHEHQVLPGHLVDVLRTDHPAMAQRREAGIGLADGEGRGFGASARTDGN